MNEIDAINDPGVKKLCNLCTRVPKITSYKLFWNQRPPSLPMRSMIFHSEGIPSVLPREVDVSHNEVYFTGAER